MIFLCLFAMIAAFLLMLVLNGTLRVIFGVIFLLYAIYFAYKFYKHRHSLKSLFLKREDIPLNKKIILDSIKTTNLEYEEVKIENSCASVIIKNKKGLFAYYMINLEGHLTGSMYDEVLTLRKGEYSKTFKKDTLLYIENDLNNLNVNKIIVCKNNFVFGVTNFYYAKVIKLKDVNMDYLKTLKN